MSREKNMMNINSFIDFFFFCYFMEQKVYNEDPDQYFFY